MKDAFRAANYAEDGIDVSAAVKEMRKNMMDQTPDAPMMTFPESDRLSDMFRRQEEFMRVLKDADKMPEWPIDITSKFGQRHIKEVNANMVAELFEAMYILKNRPHRFTDHTDVDFGHFKEELGDALAFFMELCIMAGISADELYEEYCRKNQIVKQRAQEGY